MFVYVMFVCIHAFNMAVHFRRPLFTADYGIKKYLKKMAFLTFFSAFCLKIGDFFTDLEFFSKFFSGGKLKPDKFNDVKSLVAL